MDLDKIKAPFLHSSNNECGFFNKVSLIKKTSKSLLHVYNDSIIIDSNGTVFKISNAYQTGWAYIWGFHPFYNERMIKIDINIKETSSIALDELKKMLIEMLNSNIKFGFPINKHLKIKIIEKIKNANSYEDVMASFLYDIDD